MPGNKCLKDKEVSHNVMRGAKKSMLHIYYQKSYNIICLKSILSGNISVISHLVYRKACIVCLNEWISMRFFTTG